MVKARLIVKGNVQGVGYRTLVKLFARRLGINGLVRNLDDGSVETFVDGSKLAIRRFLEGIDVKGKPEDPLSLHVEGIDVYWEGKPGYMDAWKSYSGFELDYGVDGLSPAEKETLESLEWSKLHFTGMSNVLREELGGVKGEIRETRGDVKGVHSEIKEMRGDLKGMHKDLKEDTTGIKRVIIDMHRDLKEDTTGIKGAIGEMHKDLRDEIVGVRSEIRDMHVDMGKSFEEMAKRYDVISAELVRTREELTRTVDALLKLIEKFIHERRGT